MKRFYTIAFIMVSFSNWFNLASAQNVKFPDVNLAKKVREALNLPVGAAIPKAQLATLTILEASAPENATEEEKISDLTGLEHATQLTALYLWENQISEIKPLAGLTQLMELGLGVNEIRDISSLAKLTQLTFLDLALNEIQDISPLTELTQLTGLALWGNQINNMSSLAKLTQLTFLDLGSNEIQDIKPLSGLTSLTTLDLRNNRINHVTALAGLVHLENLYLAGNPIIYKAPLRTLLVQNPNLELDINTIDDPAAVWMPDPNLRAAVRDGLGLAPSDPLTQQALQELTELDAPGIEISDITGLEHATQLTDLFLINNRISDLTPLAGLTQLVGLELTENEISDLSPLIGLTQLTVLGLIENEISDLNPLAGLVKLTDLFLFGNPITDVSPLLTLLEKNPNMVIDIDGSSDPAIAWMPNLKLHAAARRYLNLAPDNTLTQNALQGLTQLTLQEKQVNTLTGLEHATQLTTLSLNGNQISDITLLEGLTQLTELYLSDNEIRDISSLSGLTQLTTLALDFNQISDITSLQGLTKLTTLVLDGNTISDITSLAQLTQLKNLYLGWETGGNTISDITSLAQLTQLKNLYLQNNQISDVTALAGLVNLDRLLLMGNSITDTVPLQSLLAKNSDLQLDINLTSLSDAPTQSVFPDTTVRLIYFVPRDRTPQLDINAKLDTLIKDVQEFFADEMERHGLGRKTFAYETDNFGKAVVHHVKGQFADAHYHHKTIGKVTEEIDKRFDTSKNIYLMVIDISTEIIDIEACGVAYFDDVGGPGGPAIIPASGNCFVGDFGFPTTAAHELGHAFGLAHNFRNNTYLMSYGEYRTNKLSPCSADWLDASRYFTPHQTLANNSETTIEMLPLLLSPSHAIRLQFNIIDADNLKCAQLITLAASGDEGAEQQKLLDCKTLEGESQTLEFVTTELTTESKSVTIRILDGYGNLASQDFPIDTTTLYPSPQTVSIPDVNLAAALRETLGLSDEADITQLDMLRLRELHAEGREITNLTGLEYAKNLKYLSLVDNQISDITVLAKLPNLANLSIAFNQVSDFSPIGELTNLVVLDLSGNPADDITSVTILTQLQSLSLDSKEISDITSLTSLTNLIALSLNENQISAITPLAGLTQLTTLRLSNNQISDVNALTGLTELTLLELGDNQINTITPLAGLTQLTTLRLSNNQISDVNALTGLVKLEYLFLEGNPITDKSPLHTLLGQNPQVQIDIIPVSAVNIASYVPVDASERPRMYWVDTTFGTLYHLTGEKVEKLVQGVQNITELAVDVAGGKVYWSQKTSDTTGKIQRANLDGTNVQLVKELTSVPHAIALDIASGKIYLTNSWDKLQRLNVDGTNLQPNLITGLNSPRDIVLDIAAGKVYWTELAGQIRQANLNGSNIQTLVTDLGTPGGIAVADGKIYWTEKTDENSGKIQCANLNGTPNVEELTTLTSVPLGIAVDATGSKLYWTNSNKQIQRSNLSGEDIQEVVAELGAPADITLGTEPVPTSIAAAPAIIVASPDQTALLPNYPNPFNPETWIPYQLAKPADVTFTIYAVNGQVVRRLALGHQLAGSYQSKSRAAYWDGRNAVDERVASGIYFYSFTAGDFSATRKMLIMK